MNVLMFGWEFPPLNQGGLGTACFGLTRSMSKEDVSITFVLPSLSQDIPQSHVKIVSADDKKVKITKIDSPLQAYMTSQEYRESMQLIDQKVRKKASIYGENLFEEVYRYAQKAAGIALEENPDIIHCHDWLTFKAGMEAKKATGKPLVLHVHATEFDRTGGNGVNQYVYDTEREGMHFADKIIAVSNYTKQKIVEKYAVPPEKIEVIHNGVDQELPQISEERYALKDYDRVILFLGRITLQKGPEYFIDAAKKVLEYEPNVKFIVAGSGDMEFQMIERAAAHGISEHVLFSGFLRGEDVDKAYRTADLFVMPSVSEPFGIAPLEAMKNGTPVIISKQSGVSEVITHCLKVDFWDTHDMANKMIAILRYNELQKALGMNGHEEVKRMSWDIPARKCVEVYKGLVGGGSW